MGHFDGLPGAKLASAMERTPLDGKGAPKRGKGFFIWKSLKEPEATEASGLRMGTASMIYSSVMAQGTGRTEAVTCEATKCQGQFDGLPGAKWARSGSPGSKERLSIFRYHQ